MANMVLGMLILNKRYTALKYLSVIIITLGIAISTIASGQSRTPDEKLLCTLAQPSWAYYDSRGNVAREDGRHAKVRLCVRNHIGFRLIPIEYPWRT